MNYNLPHQEEQFIVEAFRFFCDNKFGMFHFIGGTSFENVVWETQDYSQPTLEQFTSKLSEIKFKYEQNSYQRLRYPEYPPITDYIDGVVKGDQEQIQNYIDACLEVKAKYPKP